VVWPAGSGPNRSRRSASRTPPAGSADRRSTLPLRHHGRGRPCRRRRLRHDLRHSTRA
jgi:hypothetical protein